MPNIPPRRDPNRPKSRAVRGTRAEADAPPQRRTQSNDDAHQDGALSRHDESDGGLGVQTGGGYPEQQPAPGKRASARASKRGTREL